MSDWKFDLDEVGPEAEDETWAPPIEPGSPRMENVIPFLLGIALAVFIFVQVI